MTDGHWSDKIMTMPSRNAILPQAKKHPPALQTLARIVAAILMVNLRDALGAQNRTDRSDVVLHYGLL
jgi:hypothetical protein